LRADHAQTKIERGDDSKKGHHALAYDSLIAAAWANAFFVAELFRHDRFFRGDDDVC